MHNLKSEGTSPRDIRIGPRKGWNALVPAIESQVTNQPNGIDVKGAKAKHDNLIEKIFSRYAQYLKALMEGANLVLHGRHTPDT